MKTDRRTIVLLAAVLIGCMCVCMATKEGLEGDNPCEWILPKDETNTRNCNACPDGDFLIVTPGKDILAGFNKYTCGKSS